VHESDHETSLGYESEPTLTIDDTHCEVGVDGCGGGGEGTSLVEIEKSLRQWPPIWPVHRSVAPQMLLLASATQSKTHEPSSTSASGAKFAALW